MIILFHKCLDVSKLPTEFDSGPQVIASESMISAADLAAADFHFRFENLDPIGPFIADFSEDPAGGWQYALVGPGEDFGGLALSSAFLLPKDVRGGFWQIDISVAAASAPPGGVLPDPHYLANMGLRFSGMEVLEPVDASWPGPWPDRHGTDEFGNPIDVDWPTRFQVFIPEVGGQPCLCRPREWPTIGVTRGDASQLQAWQVNITGRWLGDSPP